MQLVKQKGGGTWATPAQMQAQPVQIIKQREEEHFDDDDREEGLPGSNSIPARRIPQRQFPPREPPASARGPPDRGPPARGPPVERKTEAQVAQEAEDQAIIMKKLASEKRAQRMAEEEVKKTSL